MKKPIIIIFVLAVSLVAVYYWTNRARPISKDKAERITQFLRTVAADTLEQDYKRHHMQMSAIITNLEVHRITSEDKLEYILYSAQGSVSYRVRGKRDWLDQEGNRIHLDPETEITHKFTCGVREDRYGYLYKDDRKRFELYADDVTP